MKNIHFRQQGQRSYQQDSMYIDSKGGLYIVCDGIGGSVRGDLASKTVIEGTKEYFHKLDNAKIDWEEFCDQIYRKLLKQLSEVPEAEEMGTTLVFGYFTREGLWIVHVGDSRAYQVRPKEDTFWVTKDHSLVQELYESGVLESEGAMEEHPKSSVITRAFQAKRDTKPPKCTVQYIKDIQAGDIFMFCSDGVLEPWSVHSHVPILCDEEKSFEEKTKEIQKACRAISSDNNTAIFLKIEDEDIICQGRDLPERSWRSINTLPSVSEKDNVEKDDEVMPVGDEPNQQYDEKGKSGIRGVFIKYKLEIISYLLILIIGLLAILLIWFNLPPKNKDKVGINIQGSSETGRLMGYNNYSDQSAVLNINATEPVNHFE